jgi:hypothetical protein
MGTKMYIFGPDRYKEISIKIAVNVLNKLK